MINPDTISLAISLAQLTPSDRLSQMTKDAYEALLLDLKRKIGEDEAAQYALNGLLKKPSSQARREVLTEELTRLNLYEDESLQKLTEFILEALQLDGAWPVIQGDVRSGGTVIADSGNISQAVTGSTVSSQQFIKDVKVDSGGDKDDNE